jgi:hypothetical protein
VLCGVVVASEIGFQESGLLRATLVVSVLSNGGRHSLLVHAMPAIRTGEITYVHLDLADGGIVEDLPPWEDSRVEV